MSKTVKGALLPVLLMAILVALRSASQEPAVTPPPVPTGDAAAALAKEILQATGVEAGLCVHLGTTDGELEAKLARGGRMLVHGLAADDAAVRAARAFLQDQGLYGFVSVAKLSPRAVPYADNLINLLVADLDALGARAPGEPELMRAVAPRGVAYLKKKGAWAKVVKPMPQGMDGWTHFYHGPDGNPVSQDEGVGPPTGLQWLAGVSAMGAEPTTGYRLAGGRALYEWEGPNRRSAAPAFLVCRDAFSGVILWEKPTTIRPHKTRPIVMTDDRVYTYLETDGPLVALDARTGEVVRTYDQGGRADKKISGNRSDVNLVFHDGLLVQTAGNTVYVLDAQSGVLKWKYAEPEGRFVDYPTVGAGTGQVFLTTGLTPRDAGRYPGADTREVLAFDLKTGKPQWRREMGRELSQLCLSDGALFAFNLAGFIGRPRDLFLARLRPEDGSVVWKINPGAKGQFLDFSIINHKIYVMSLGLKVYDAADGKEIASLPMPGNSRCEMSRASKNTLLMSFGNFIDLSKEPLQLQRCEISRGSCGTGNTPGYGMLYYNPNRCQCFVSVRGYLAASREPVRAAIPDEKRLEVGDTAPSFGKGPARWPAEGQWPIYLGNPLRSSSTAAKVPADLRPLWKVAVQSVPSPTAGPLLADLLHSSHFNGPVTSPVIAGGRTFVAVPEAHRVEALDSKSGRKLWSYTAGGRVDTPPTIYGDLCLFGCRDGQAYALDARSGKLCWRFLAAPYERLMVAHNQLESTWPIFGSVAVVDGTLVVAAGRHPETNGGIIAYGLEPHTGKLLWKRPISHERMPGTLGKTIPDDGITTRRYGYNANTVLNEILIGDGRLLAMTGLTLEAKTGEIANTPWPKKVPGKPQALPEPPMGFHFDLGFRPPYRDQKLENYGGPGADHGSWVLRLSRPKLEVHGELIAFNKERVAVTKVAGIDWAMWDLSGEQLPGEKDKGRQNSSHPPTWSAPKNHVKGMEVTAVILAGETMLIGLSSPRGTNGVTTGEVRLYSTRDATPLGRLPLDAGVIQAGLAVADGRLYVSCDDGTVRCFGE